MKISTKTRYGLRVLIYIGCQERNVQIKEIAKNEDISIKYLEQIVNHLKNADLLSVTRGSKGGYRLSKDPQNLTLKNIFNVLEGTTNLVDCLEDKKCFKSDSCVTRNVWDGLAMAMDSYLESITLFELIEEKRNKQHTVMYYI